MNKNEFSPYIRIATLSTIKAPFRINERMIYDYEIILVCDGKCDIIIDGISYHCKKNNVVFIRPGISHEFECKGNVDFVQPHIHFDISYSQKSEQRVVSFKPRRNMSFYELDLIQEDVFKQVNIPLVFTPYDLKSFSEIFFEIIEIYQGKKYNYELLCKIKMLSLLDSVLKQFSSDKTVADYNAPNTVVAIKDYIDNNYMAVITLSSLAEQFHMNKYTLMRNFKALYKDNVISYYHSKKTEHIKNALKSTSLSITSLAETLGFSDVYSLSRFFKKRVGCSPGEYRRKSRL